MNRHLKLAPWVLVSLTLPIFAQDSGNQNKNKNVDITSPVGDLHLGADADARKAGLPLYPGARLKSDDENKSQANLSVLTERFGVDSVQIYDHNFFAQRATTASGTPAEKPAVGVQQ